MLQGLQLDVEAALEHVLRRIDIDPTRVRHTWLERLEAPELGLGGGLAACAAMPRWWLHMSRPHPSALLPRCSRHPSHLRWSCLAARWAAEWRRMARCSCSATWQASRACAVLLLSRMRQLRMPHPACEGLSALGSWPRPPRALSLMFAAPPLDPAVCLNMFPSLLLQALFLKTPSRVWWTWCPTPCPSWRRWWGPAGAPSLAAVERAAAASSRRQPPAAAVRHGTAALSVALPADGHPTLPLLSTTQTQTPQAPPPNPSGCSTGWCATTGTTCRACSSSRGCPSSSCRRSRWAGGRGCAGPSRLHGRGMLQRGECSHSWHCMRPAVRMRCCSLS